jgi:hypothetical protein
LVQHMRDGTYLLSGLASLQIFPKSLLNLVRQLLYLEVYMLESGYL